MLLKNKFFLILIIVIILFSSITIAQMCEVAHARNTLRKALFDYLGDPSTAQMELPKIKDLLDFYLDISEGTVRVDCSGKGPNSGSVYETIINEADNITTSLPTCVDGTPYGECSTITKPKYCHHAKKLLDRCKICGCPENEVCKGQKCRKTKEKIACNVNADCGISDYVGDYSCQDNDLYRNYTKYTCLNPGEIDSNCLNETTPVLIDDCEVGEECVGGENGSCEKPCTTPTNGMFITEDTTFCPGTYNLPNGIKIGSTNNIVLDCNGAVLIGTTLYNCGIGGIGVQLIDSQNNQIKNCVIKSYLQAIALLFGSSNNEILDNSFSEDCTGILLASSNQNVISNNRITDSKKLRGIYAWGSSDNKIYDNYFSGNSGVIFAADTSNNIIYHNNFISSSQSDAGTNQWESNQEGNYWSNFNGTDTNCDGIGDVPYGKDNYPFMEMDGWLKTYTSCIQNQTCTDSDGGLEYYEKGTLYSKVVDMSFTDFCSLPSGSQNRIKVDECGGGDCKLHEFQCDESVIDGTGETILYDCPNGCRDGACIS